MLANDLGRLTRRLQPSARPLAIVFMVPLAASCFLATPQSIGTFARDVAPRTIDVSLLPDRWRDAAEAVAADPAPHDPPFRAPRWTSRGSAQAATSGAVAIAPLMVRVPAVLPEIANTFQISARRGAHPRRGPPGHAT
jgi:hypothetical protein